MVARCNSADACQRGILVLVRLQGMQKNHGSGAVRQMAGQYLPGHLLPQGIQMGALRQHRFGVSKGIWDQ